MLYDYIASTFWHYLQNLRTGTCLLCQDATSFKLDLCKACANELPYLEHACVQCGLPLPELGTQKMCGACLNQPSSLPYRIFSPFIYQFPIDRLIMALKFKHQLSISKVLGHLMADEMQKVYQNRELPQVIIPMPLHRNRLRERGFNQSLELARPISQALTIPIDSHSCSRVRHTKPQMDLPKEARAHNVSGAFAIKKGFHAKRICLIDDVVTTGHTAMSLSKVLLKAGVESIDIWCCARASLKTPKV